MRWKRKKDTFLVEIYCISSRDIYPKVSKEVIDRKISYFMVVYEGQSKI